jgi:hypothetical protein
VGKDKPEGKEGVNIERAKYDGIRAAIIATLEQSKTGKYPSC